MPNPERVELVRLRLGLTKSGFAEQLCVDRKTLQRFERTSDMSHDMFEKLCLISGYPQEFFEKSDAEYPNPDGVSFRSLRSLTASSRNSALAAAALAFEIDDWVHERFDLPEHSLPQVLSESPMEAAGALRAHWGYRGTPNCQYDEFTRSSRSASLFIS